MNRILQCLRLDFYTVKPYRQALYRLLGLGFILGFVINRSVSILSSMLMMGLVIMMSYPFSIGDKYGMDTLYGTLPITRRDVVTGRYLFVICLELIGAGLVLLGGWLINQFIATDILFPELMLTISTLTAVASIMAAFQFPAFFRLGYARAKAYSYVPFVLVFVIIGMLPTLIKTFGWSINERAIEHFLETNPLLPVVVLVAVSLLSLGISWALSVRFYERRDL